MEKLKGKALDTCPPEFKPSLWLLYVDDVVETIQKDKVQEFTTYLNNLNPSIQFTVETQTREDDGCEHLPVLDVDIERR